MSDYRRWYVEGGTYFFTLVTYARRPILTTEEGRRALRSAIHEVRRWHPFTIIATVLLPDHWHLVTQLPPGDANYSLRIKQIKARFTELWLASGGQEAEVTASQRQRGERGVWQPRFWEHTIQDEGDLESCVDYVHWNPCKHGLVTRPVDWPWSTFHRFVARGHFDPKWGRMAPACLQLMRDWGESTA